MPLDIHPLFCDPSPAAAATQGSEHDVWEWEQSHDMRIRLLGCRAASIVAAISAYYLLPWRSAKLVSEASSAAATAAGASVSSTSCWSAMSSLPPESSDDIHSSQRRAWDDVQKLLQLQEMSGLNRCPPGPAAAAGKDDSEGCCGDASTSKNCNRATCIDAFEYEFEALKPFLMQVGKLAVRSCVVSASVLKDAFERTNTTTTTTTTTSTQTKKKKEREDDVSKKHDIRKRQAC